MMMAAMTMTMTKARLATAAAVLVVAGAACSDGPLLEEVGDVSQRIVHGDTTSTTVALLTDDGESVLRVIRSSTLAWFNADLAEVEDVEPAVVLNRVWIRGEGVNRFIQAGPREIAAVLPGVGFPSVVPDTAQVVTSQLVFDVGSGLLDVNTSAAFGVWTTTPYSVGREEGQIAVLRVGQASAFDVDPFAGIESQSVEEGIALTWVEGEFRYELFCRTGLSDLVCNEMAENLIPLVIASR